MRMSEARKHALEVLEKTERGRREDAHAEQAAQSPAEETTLRALLKEARAWVEQGNDFDLRDRIDAALEEGAAAAERGEAGC